MLRYDRGLSVIPAMKAAGTEIPSRISSASMQDWIRHVIYTISQGGLMVVPCGKTAQSCEPSHRRSVDHSMYMQTSSPPGWST